MDTLFFIAAKVVWGVLRPDAWIVLGAGLTLLALWRCGEVGGVRAVWRHS